MQIGCGSSKTEKRTKRSNWSQAAPSYCRQRFPCHQANKAWLNFEMRFPRRLRIKRHYEHLLQLPLIRQVQHNAHPTTHTRTLAHTHVHSWAGLQLTCLNFVWALAIAFRCHGSRFKLTDNAFQGLFPNNEKTRGMTDWEMPYDLEYQGICVCFPFPLVFPSL